MTSIADVHALLSALRLAERFYFRNLALETILEFHRVPDWRSQSEAIATNRDIQPEVRARFERLYEELERDLDLSVVEAFLRSVPRSGEPN